MLKHAPTSSVGACARSDIVTSNKQLNPAAQSAEGANLRDRHNRLLAQPGRKNSTFPSQTGSA
jgi:hypothetical protein